MNLIRTDVKVKKEKKKEKSILIDLKEGERKKKECREGNM